MINIRSIAAATLAAAIITPASATAAWAPPPQGVVKSALSTPCEYEDSINCYWDAYSQTNHRGHSFYSVRVGKEICTIYWNRKYNRKNGFCAPIDRPTKGVAEMGPIEVPKDWPGYDWKGN